MSVSIPLSIPDNTKSLSCARHKSAEKVSLKPDISRKGHSFEGNLVTVNILISQ